MIIDLCTGTVEWDQSPGASDYQEPQAEKQATTHCI